MTFSRELIQKEAIEALLKVEKGCAILPVRSGKTFVGHNLASKFDKVIVSYPNTSILEGWLNDAEKFGFITDHITFTTHLSLNKLDISDYSCIILDEIDQFSVNQWENLVFNLPNFKGKLYGLTATPPNKGEKKAFLDEYCPIIYERTLDETTGVTNKDYEIIVHLLRPSKTKDIPLSKGRFWSEEAKLNFWENKYYKTKNFMDMLKLIQAIQNSKTKLDYLKQLSTKIDRCLIFLETKEQCNNLPYPTYFSGNKNSEDNLQAFQEEKINKLSCVRQLSAGITFPNLKECIILHAYASNNKFHQRFGRTLNYVEGEKATIHLICLDGTKDRDWVNKALSEFDQNKIKYLKV